MENGAPPLFQYWHDGYPPPPVVVTLDSFKEHNPDLEQIVFDEASAERFIEAHYGARHAAAFQSCAVPAMQADYFRYCAIHARGGFYADANFRCVDNLGGLLDGDSHGVLFGRTDPVPDWLAELYGWPYPVGIFREVANGMFGFERSGHPLLELAIEVATANIENRVGEGPVGVWITAGPGVLTSLYLLRELDSIDAFLKFSAGSVIEPSAEVLCDVVCNVAAVQEAWSGVEIRPLEEMDRWGVKTNDRPRGTRWHWFQGSIYR